MRAPLQRWPQSQDTDRPAIPAPLASRHQGRGPRRPVALAAVASRAVAGVAVTATALATVMDMEQVDMDTTEDTVPVAEIAPAAVATTVMMAETETSTTVINGIRRYPWSSA
ncbi:MAG TPA: hypothetical protein VFZ27_15985 [Terriglobia bacterium]|nr:hypothetical protein [Terriglobia bacterium]